MSQNNKSLPIWPKRLIQAYFYLTGSTFDELRAVIAKSSTELLEIYFYHDGELENKKWDACSIVACEIWDPDIGEELTSDIIRLDFPKPIPSLKEGEFYLYRRREPFLEPIPKNELPSTSLEKTFFPLVPTPTHYSLDFYDINALFGETLVGEIIPSLREIFIFWNKSTILANFTYNGKLNEGKVVHAEQIIEKIRHKCSSFSFILRIERCDFQTHLPFPEYNEAENQNLDTEYRIKYFGKEIPFPILTYSKFVVFSKMK